jgi:HAD superfamily phosphoserine phosphatase-like hydrolase
MKTSNTPALTSAAREFIESVLRLQPQVAAFDCDGTLWSGDAGERFFDWEIRERLVPEDVGRAMRARYAEYKAGKIGEEQMCGEMATMHNGIPESELQAAATDFFDKFFLGQIFPEMRELVSRVKENGCEVWAVSSSNEWVILAGMKHFGIPKERVLATSVEIENGIVTDRLVRVPSGPAKPQALRGVVRNEIGAAFGNSRWDTEMLALARHPFAVNPNSDLEATARRHGWKIYFPNGTGH